MVAECSLATFKEKNAGRGRQLFHMWYSSGSRLSRWNSGRFQSVAAMASQNITSKMLLCGASSSCELISFQQSSTAYSGCFNQASRRTLFWASAAASPQNRWPARADWIVRM